MSRYYPSSRGTTRGRGGYNYSSGASYSSRGGGGYSSGSTAYASSAGYATGGGASSGYYDSRSSGATGSGSTGRYYPDRDRRDTTGAASRTSSAHRAQLEIAQKLVDTLIQSSGGTGGGTRRPSDHYAAAGEPPYKRPRDDVYDRERSGSTRSRHADYHYHRRDDYTERRPPRDDFHAPARRPYRARGYAPRRGYVPRGSGPPPRRPYDAGDRDRSFDSRRDDAPRGNYPAGKQLVTKCPHCHARCATFADFRKHQLGREHMAAMRRVLMKIRAELGKMRLAQREEQKKLEAAEIEKDAEFENLPTQFCTLCRLQYREIEGVVHNETEAHRKQKTYQNPSCKTCNMNFPARIAYEKHLGTFTHIQKVSQSERRAERRDAADFQKGGFMTLDSVGDVDEEEGRAGRDASGEADEPQQSATEKLAELPEYDGKHAVGSNHMRKTEVYHCGLCDIYIKITAKVNAVLIKHCMGKKHFENYRKKLVKLAEKEEEERKAAEALAVKEEEEEEEDAKAEEGEGEKTDAPKSNGRGEKADAEDKGDDAATDGGEGAQPAKSADDAWEQMDDNFLLGDDQEEETGSEKRTVGVTE